MSHCNNSLNNHLVNNLIETKVAKETHIKFVLRFKEDPISTSASYFDPVNAATGDFAIHLDVIY